MNRPARTAFRLNIRTKLLVLLVLLSLPLLIVSLLQLNSYRRSLLGQSTTLAHVYTTAAEGALASWLEAHPQALGAAPGPTLAPALAADLYTKLRQQITPVEGAALVVRDSGGQIVSDPRAPAQTATTVNLSPHVSEQQWSDGVARITCTHRLGATGWSVAVGVPLPKHTPAWRAFITLTATWLMALAASGLLAVWAIGRFTEPLRRLAASASSLGHGQLHERVEVETDDEVGTLASGFNVMASSLEGQFSELRTQSAFIAEVLDSLPLGVVVLDAHLIVRKVNSTFARFVGREAATLTGRGLYEAAAGLAVISEIVEDVRRTRRSFVNYGLPLDLVARTAETDEAGKYWDVTLWPVAESSSSRGDLILILSEVSKRVRAEKLATGAFAAEKARAAELESVINQMDEGVVIVDERGRYRVNPAAARILDRKPGEFRDGVQALITDMALRDAAGQLIPPAATPIGRALEHGEHVQGQHVQIVRGAGAEGVLAVSATPLVGEGERRVGVVAVFRDITGEVRQYRELMEAYGRLREHDRLKSAFVANVSHELRTPLNVIIGLCQLLARDQQTPLVPVQQESVTRMERNARSLLELVNDLLAYSRLEAGRSALQLEVVNVAEIATDVLNSYRAEAAAKHIELRVAIAPDLPPVLSDRRKLTQVLANLISNAVKFTASGSITIAAAPLADGRWQLEVRDTGIGISREALAFIFDEFRQADDRLARAYSGVGLGLAITRKIVELLEGEIKVESQPDAGSCFRITWPQAARARTGTGSLVREGRTPLAVVEPRARRAR